MNAIELLKNDHQKVASLFEKARATEDTAEKQRLFEQIKTELETHAHIEEAIFYPTIQEKEEFKDIVLESIEEHHQTKILLREISSLADNSEKFDAKLTVLMEGVEHHVKEEESEMFPQVESLYDKQQLNDLGAEMEDEKQTFQKSYKAGAGR